MSFERFEYQPGKAAHDVAELLFGLRLAHGADGLVGLFQCLAGSLHRGPSIGWASPRSTIVILPCSTEGMSQAT